MTNFSRPLWLAAAILALASPTRAETAYRQSLDDAWWAGPLLANSAATLGQGHVLVESYLYDEIKPHSDGAVSLSYFLYGVTDRFTVGLIPVAGYNRVDNAPSGAGLGDTTLQFQYGLSAFDSERGIPAISVTLQETLPTGRYDRLGGTLANGLGGGAFTTNLAIFSQHYFWLPNGRLLRTRLNVAHAFSTCADVQDASVYGTATGFRGSAQPGNALSANLSLEYSLTRRAVLALDFQLHHNDAARVDGFAGTAPVNLNSGTSGAFTLAPALEYSWTPNIGVLAGVRVIFKGHHTEASITPAIAINYVH